MNIPPEVSYRLRLVEGFLVEAQQDHNLRRWRSWVDNSQLATESAAFRTAKLRQARMNECIDAERKHLHKIIVRFLAAFNLRALPSWDPLVHVTTKPPRSSWATRAPY